MVFCFATKLLKIPETGIIGRLGFDELPVLRDELKAIWRFSIGKMIICLDIR